MLLQSMYLKVAVGMLLNVTMFWFQPKQCQSHTDDDVGQGWGGASAVLELGLGSILYLVAHVEGHNAEERWPRTALVGG